MKRSKKYRLIEAKAKRNGFVFESDSTEFAGNPYCVWFNSPTGSKEIFCANLIECDVAIGELIAIRNSEAKLSPEQITEITNIGLQKGYEAVDHIPTEISQISAV